jgi:dUTP pyrophosphatase
MQNTTLKFITISKKVTEKSEDEFDVIYPMSKAICQAALEVVPEVIEKEISYDELLQIPSERGTGALGSSGK